MNATATTPLTDEAPLDPIVHQRRWISLGVLCLSLTIIVMDNTILNVAIPALLRDLDASNSEVQWIIDAYVLVFAGLLLTMGSLSDRFGRKGALQTGIVLFGLGSTGAALSNSANQLILARAFMGIGGALIMPATLSIITNIFRTPSERARAIAAWAGFAGLGVAIGPVTGGLLLEHFSWHSVFWVNLPLGALALGLGAFLVPTSRDPDAGRLDPLGALSSIVGLAALLFAIIEAPERGWNSPQVVAGFVVATTALGAFVLWERRAPHPMLDMSVFRNARFSAASGTITLVFFALFGIMFILTQYWQLVQGYSALETGIRMLPHAATMMVVSPLSARLVEHADTKRVVLGGLGLLALGLLLMSTVDASSSYGEVISYFLVMSAGMGLTMAPATESVMGSLPRSKAGVGSAVNDTTRQVGGALGVALIGSVVSSIYASEVRGTAEQFGLNEAQTDLAGDSLGAAQRLGTDLGARAMTFVADANDAFVHAMSIGLRVSTVIIGVAAAVVWRYLPSQGAEAEHAPAPRDATPPNQPELTPAELAPIVAAASTGPPARTVSSAGD